MFENSLQIYIALYLNLIFVLDYKYFDLITFLETDIYSKFLIIVYI